MRLDVSGGRFPCYDRNPHVADGSPDTTAAEHVVATIEVWRAEIDLPALPVLRVAPVDTDQPFDAVDTDDTGRIDGPTVAAADHRTMQP